MMASVQVVETAVTVTKKQFFSELHKSGWSWQTNYIPSRYTKDI